MNNQTFDEFATAAMTDHRVWNVVNDSRGSLSLVAPFRDGSCVVTCVRSFNMNSSGMSPHPDGILSIGRRRGAHFISSLQLTGISKPMRTAIDISGLTFIKGLIHNGSIINYTDD